MSPERSQRSGVANVSFERRLMLDVCLVLVPAALLIGYLLWSREAAGPGLWLACGLAAMFTLGLALRLRGRIVYPLYTLSNLLEALREGDYSLRGSRARRGDPIGDVIWEVNTLSQTLRERRLHEEEASALLAKVIAAIDIAIFSFDGDQRLRLINPAGERLLRAEAGRALGASAAELGLDDCLALEQATLLRRSFPAGMGSYEARRFQFRQGGRPHYLVSITDLSRALREEERQAWQRIIRVLGHELNNSLAPIKSMAATLSAMSLREPLPDDWRDDLHGGLKVIADRAESLSRFMTGYALLARLPAPTRKPVDPAEVIVRVARLEQRIPVQVQPGPDLDCQLDADQLEQALINLVRNAVEASLPEGGRVQVRWSEEAGRLRIEVLDEGLGLSGSDNLFVPFFTTKPGGSGIGLVLARQIAEGHGGSLVLANRTDRRGCVARLEFPLT
jgi:nitrogen fixation/metabolism regulation signal transduction histidine kinase